jgi:ABC-2 type transport system ATP-binding protein
VDTVPDGLAPWALDISADGRQLTYTYDPHSTHTGISGLLAALGESGLSVKDLNTTQSSLEEIFVNLVSIKS